MDPNENLSECRRLVERLSWREVVGADDYANVDLVISYKRICHMIDNLGNIDRLIKHFTALDEWLTTGGGLPAEWRRANDGGDSMQRHDAADKQGTDGPT